MKAQRALAEFHRRVPKKLPSQWPLADLCTVVRTHEAMERTRLARIRTKLSFATVSLGALGIMLLIVRIFLLM